MDADGLLEYPCEIPIKVFGNNVERFREEALRIVRSHCSDVSESRIGERMSSGGKYLSLTITVEVQSRDEIDAVYRELSASDDILMVL